MKRCWKKFLWFRGWGEISYNVLRFKAGRQSGERRVRSKG